MALLDLPTRIPPHNLDAERAVLGALMVDQREGPELFELVVGALSPADFYAGYNRTLYEAILAVGTRGAPVTPVTVGEELVRTATLEDAGGPAHMALCMNDRTIPARVRPYCALIREKAVLRELAAIGMALADQAFAATDEGVRVMARAHEALERLGRRAVVEPLPVHTWAEMILRTRERLNYLWPGWVVEKKVVLVAGAGDSMKSFLCVFVAAMVAAGRPALEPDANDHPCAQGPALIVSAENGYDEDTRRVQLIHRGHTLPDTLPVTVLEADQLSLRDAATWISFTAIVTAMKPRLIVIDSGISVADLDSENDNAAVAAFMKRCIAPLARVHNAAVLLIVHSPKPPTARGSLPFTDEHVARGASAWRNAADGVLYLKRDKSLGPNAVVLRPAKSRASGGVRHAPIWFRIDNTETDEHGQATAIQVRYGGEFTEETGQAAEAAAALGKAIPVAIQVLKTTPGSRISKLIESVVAAGVTEATARRAVAVIRGQKEWPSGPYKDKKQAVVDESPGPRKMVFLTFSPSMEAALTPVPVDEDDVPF